MSANSTTQNLLDSGNIPAKPSILRESSFVADFTFMLSGDFIEFNSHSEMEPSYQYEPDYVRHPTQEFDYTGYKDNHPIIAFGPYDDIYYAIDAYLQNGAETGRNFRKIDNGTFLFCTKMDYYDQLLYAYAFANATA